MAEEKVDINKLKEEIYDIIESLKKDLGKEESSEVKNIISDLQSVLENAKNINQELDNSPLANANVNKSIINIKSRDGVIELIKLLKEVLKEKSDINISEDIIKEIIKRIKNSIANVIKKKYYELCKLFESKINELLNAISKIETSKYEEITSKLESIIQGVNKILEELSNKIFNQLSILEELLEKIGNNIKEFKGEIDGLKKEVKELGDDLILNQNEIKETLKKHSKQLKTIIRILKEVNAKTDHIKKILEDLTPSSLHDLYDLINELTNKVNEVNRDVQSIKDFIAEKVFPVIEAMAQKLGELASQFPEQAKNIKEILDKIDELSETTRALPTRDEINKRFDNIEDQLKEIKRALGTTVRPSEPDMIMYNKKFELRWVIVKNKKVADKIKKNEVFPKQNDYVSINPHYLTANLNERKKEILASDYLRKVASQIISKGFDLEKIFICLGARIVGTQKPWRWDIKHLKTSTPEIYNKLRGDYKAEKSEAELIKEIEDKLNEWEHHEHLNKNPNETLRFYISDSMVKDAEKIFNNLKELSKRYYPELQRDEVFIRHLGILGLAIKAWENNNVGYLKEYKDMPHKMLINRLRAIINNLVNKPPAPPQKDRINLMDK